MNESGDDRQRQKIQAFWNRVERRLLAHARFSAVRLLHFTNREGVYLLLATLVLLAFVALGAASCLTDEFSFVAAIFPVYYIVDAILMNTTITFVSQQPIHRLRSVLLTVLNFFNVGIAYGAIYATERFSFAHRLTFVKSIYFSFVTLTTVGFGDISPGGATAWQSEVTIIFEICTGLYLLACVLSVVVSWTQRPNDMRSNTNW